MNKKRCIASGKPQISRALSQGDKNANDGKSRAHILRANRRHPVDSRDAINMQMKEHRAHSFYDITKEIEKYL